jgi:hypothetical protein
MTDLLKKKKRRVKCVCYFSTVVSSLCIRLKRKVSFTSISLLPKQLLGYNICVCKNSENVATSLDKIAIESLVRCGFCSTCNTFQV